MERSINSAVSQLANDRFLFLSGPRQVGKTTIARKWLSERAGMYLNWDIPEDREKILTVIFTSKVKSLEVADLVLDEIHKYARWKSALKGLFDRELSGLRVIVTGSAKLDTYQKGGDSLLGRYEHLRVHPLTIGELHHGRIVEPPRDVSEWRELGQDEHEDLIARLEERSGFPEPYFSKDPQRYARWSRQRRQQLIKEDIRDLSQIKLLSLLEHMVLLLNDRIGAPLSINSLREDIGINHATATEWLRILERLYYTFIVPPYSRKIARALRKEPKLYLWDWASVQDPGPRFENLVASHLLKSVTLWTDLGFGDFALSYCRNKQKQEIDFLVLKNGSPIAAIECKHADASLTGNWAAFDKVLHGCAKIQLVRSPKVDRRLPNGVRLVSASKWLSGLC